MKYPRLRDAESPAQSHPARGAWIEMVALSPEKKIPNGRTPHGVRGLKYWMEYVVANGLGRTPHGVRGLKSKLPWTSCHSGLSHPARGAWIEIVCPGQNRNYLRPSHPARGAWIEINYDPGGIQPMGRRTPHGVRGLKYATSTTTACVRLSHPARGAWIEIFYPVFNFLALNSRTPHGVRGLK